MIAVKKIIIIAQIIFFGVGYLIFARLSDANAQAGQAEGLTGQEIIKRQDDLMRGNSLQGRYSMTVVTPDWERTLELDVYETGRDNTFIRIVSPAKEAGTATLRVKENMWNYLPTVERTIKIPPSMMLQAWMGSDFANDDLVKESSIINDYTHNILGEEMVDGNSAYKVELIPKPQAAVTWGKLIMLVRKDDFVPLREEYYREGGKLIKVLKFSEIKKMSDREIPTRWEMTPFNKEGCKSVIKVVNVEYNQPVDSGFFTLENLKKAR